MQTRLVLVVVILSNDIFCIAVAWQCIESQMYIWSANRWKNNRGKKVYAHFIIIFCVNVYVQVDVPLAHVVHAYNWIEFHEKLHLNHINQNKMDFKEWITDGPYFGMQNTRHASLMFFFFSLFSIAFSAQKCNTCAGYLFKNLLQGKSPKQLRIFVVSRFNGLDIGAFRTCFCEFNLGVPAAHIDRVC